MLLIEDNLFNLKLAEIVFETAGFKILKAKNGEQAISITENYENDIDFALLDIILPDMGAEDIYPRIKAARPEMKVIISGGYTRQEAAEKIHSMDIFDFIQKPFNPEILKHKIKQWIEK
ncbi:response regulator [Desulfonema limicola]|nr:response regulator [Desulfonema limicola]